MSTIDVQDHPLLRAEAFTTTFSAALEEGPTPAWLVGLLAEGAPAPLTRAEDVRAGVRDLLRVGGYRPTGRGKPASEYLVKAVADGRLGTINPAVDACNVVSYHSGLPISVIDLDRATAPLRIALAPAGASYVFNVSGQEIDLGGLLCLWDADGPCANAVKDAQRTKTSPQTRRTLSVVWASEGMEERLRTAVAWYRELLERLGATTEANPLRSVPEGEGS